MLRFCFSDGAFDEVLFQPQALFFHSLKVLVSINDRDRGLEGLEFGPPKQPVFVKIVKVSDVLNGDQVFLVTTPLLDTFVSDLRVGPKICQEWPLLAYLDNTI